MSPIFLLLLIFKAPETLCNRGKESETNHHTSGNFSEEEIEFNEIYANTTADIQPLQNGPTYKCGIVDIDTSGFRSFTTLKPNRLWANAKINWNFVTIGDQNSFYKDVNIGLSKADVDTVKAAMKQIEDETCFKFEQVKNPTKGQPWLLIHRIGKHREHTCQLSYVQQNLVGKDIAGLGDIFSNFMDDTKETVCFNGAFAGYGSDIPQSLVISQTELNAQNQDAVGLIVHELLHNLGLGHTQKRQDAKDNIDINWKNIDETRHDQYKACIEEDDPACKNYKNYNTYRTPYDCSSIMHYGYTDFLSKEAQEAQGQKTMVAKDPRTCKLSPYGKNKLSKTDVDIINKMYCKGTR